MLTNTIDLVEQAHKRGTAVVAFNTYDLELTRGIVAAAEQLQQPIILQLGVQSIKTYGEPLAAATIAAARVAQVPIAVNLDHCPDLAMIEQCLSWGFSSALADGSRLPFADNIAFTKQAVALAHRHGATIEAELGYLAGTEDGITVAQREASLTDPARAREFIERTGAALLAISIGNVHGYTPTPPSLDFARLTRIAEQVAVPLVLHGVSGIGKEGIQQAIRLGIVRLNINTEVRTAFVKAIANWGIHVGPEPDLRKKGQDLLDLMQGASTAAQDVAAQMIRIGAFLD